MKPIAIQAKEINNLFNFDQEKVDIVYLSQPISVENLKRTTWILDECKILIFKGLVQIISQWSDKYCYWLF